MSTPSHQANQPVSLLAKKINDAVISKVLFEEETEHEYDILNAHALVFSETWTGTHN
jgi:hypothetical protein